MCEHNSVDDSVFQQAKQLFEKLTDEQRMEILENYCTYCGQNEKIHGKCYCAPQYDE